MRPPDSRPGHRQGGGLVGKDLALIDRARKALAEAKTLGDMDLCIVALRILDRALDAAESTDAVRTIRDVAVEARDFATSEVARADEEIAAWRERNV